jgi:hypothetical protein
MPAHLSARRAEKPAKPVSFESRDFLINSPAEVEVEKLPSE